MILNIAAAEGSILSTSPKHAITANRKAKTTTIVLVKVHSFHCCREHGTRMLSARG